MFYILTILGLLVGFYFIAYKARPAKNQQGNNINPPKSGFNDQHKTELIIGTYNIQTGKNSKGKRDIFRSASVLKNADIVGIQEVYAATWLGVKNQAEQLAQFNDFGWLFAATRHRWLREHRGNALLSKLPIKKWSVEMLPDTTGKQFRNLITASLDFNGQKITLLITHLHTKHGRTQQLQTVLEKFDHYDRVILIGDMNTDKDNDLIKTFISKSNHLDAIAVAMPELQTQERIDWIFTKGFKVGNGHFEPIGISDHPYYQVNLSLLRD